jgi:putative ABC transport system substrate-binding protein
MKRREVITLLGGAAAACPFDALAQELSRTRRIGVLMNGRSRDAEQQSLVVVLGQTLQQLGWAEGRNLRTDIRWGEGDPRVIRQHAESLVASAPDVIVSTGNAGMPPLLDATRTIPIVFNNIADPVGAGYVDSMARPDGNATGFLQFEYSLSGKWLELLKEIAPGVKRASVIRDAALTAGIGQFAVIQSVAPAAGIEVSAIGLRDASEIERGVAKFARSPNGGVIVTASALSVVHRELIIGLAAQHKLPTVYYRRGYATLGGLASYGYNEVEQYRGVANYVARILNGEKPADLPVQAPTRYELVVNLKTAKALGLEVPSTLLARADEVIE